MLFLGMHRYPDVYDEGLLLTGVMRVVAGQIPHRDFYAIYGPADFYVPAVLFKLFGQSLLVDRLLNLCTECCIVSVAFAVASAYCARWIAIAVGVITILWLDGLNTYICSAVFPVALLSLVSCALLFPAFVRRLSCPRLLAAGLIAGLSALYRYDTGAATILIQVCVLVTAGYIRSVPAEVKRVAATVADIAMYLAGFLLVTAPAAIYFLSVSSLRPLLLDVVVLQAKFYSRGRSLPFPGIHLKSLDMLAVYLPVFVVVLCAYVVFSKRLRFRLNPPAGGVLQLRNAEWKGALVVLLVLAFAMFFKGYVRVGPLPMFPSLLPAMLATALLFEHRKSLPRGGITLLSFISVFFIFTALCSIAKSEWHIRKEKSMPDRLARSLAGGQAADRDGDGEWCSLSNPLTQGFCFTTDWGRRKAIEFIDTHTSPGEKLFVGLSRHDRIFINDNLFYFAAQRMPATMWSHYDPGLQNSRQIQETMIGELIKNAPPYVVLDSEFESAREPNDSSRSTGVHLLDDFIRGEYRLVQTFDEMTVWQRKGPKVASVPERDQTGNSAAHSAGWRGNAKSRQDPRIVSTASSS